MISVYIRAHRDAFFNSAPLVTETTDEHFTRKRFYCVQESVEWVHNRIFIFRLVRYVKFSARVNKKHFKFTGIWDGECIGVQYIYV